MTTVIFIRHAPTLPNKDVHATQWQLSENSQILCHTLAEQIKHYDITKIYTSTESKAQLTGQFVAEKLNNVPVKIVDHLQETERISKGYYDNEADFRAAVKIAMQSPDELLFGDETFNTAKKRFLKQVDILAHQHSDEVIVLVSHGRVLSMALGDIMRKSAIDIWVKLQMPAYATVSWEKRKLMKIQYAIEAS